MSVKCFHAQTAGFFVQLYTLAHKYACIYWRSPDYNLTRYAMSAIIALVIGTTFMGEGRPKSPVSIQDIQSVVGVLLAI